MEGGGAIVAAQCARVGQQQWQIQEGGTSGGRKQMATCPCVREARGIDGYQGLVWWRRQAQADGHGSGAPAEVPLREGRAGHQWASGLG